MNQDHIQSLLEQLTKPDSAFARKALNYYDGNQVEELIKVLSDPQRGRRFWKEKGIIPRSRNLTKAIVDKSAALFSGNEPMLEVYTESEVSEAAESINVAATAKVKEIFDDANWTEFFKNFDSQVRLLKTSLVLFQYDDVNGRVIFDALHRGNSVTVVDYNTRLITELLYLTNDGDDAQTYRHFTLETITDLRYNRLTKAVEVVGVYPNTYNLIPAVPFHDTNVPRAGFWNFASRDLVDLNEAYNLHLTDSEYAASWSKLKTLFTNAKIEGATMDTSLAFIGSDPMPKQVTEPAVVGGPGRIVTISAPPGDNVYLEYKGPEVNLTPVDEMFSNWVRDFAADWAVRLKASGEASASSGFQLIVEELDNYELRLERQKMFQAGFKRLYRAMALALPVLGLPLNGELYISFGRLVLPLDAAAEESAWSTRINEGRASRVDYFMETKGLSRAEAEAKVAEIDAYGSTPVAPAETSV